MSKDGFSENEFWSKVKVIARWGGRKVLKPALVLWYAWQRPETPTWAKGVILAALAYVIFPLDAIPDPTPLVGYADDLGVMALAASQVAASIDTEVVERANAKVNEILS